MSSQAVTPRRLAALILPVCVAGFAVLVAAGYSFATTPHSARELIGFAALTAAIHLAQHRPFQRTAFNVSVLAIVALAAGSLIAPIDGDSVGELLARVVVAATADSFINIALISGAIALSTGQRYG